MSTPAAAAVYPHLSKPEDRPEPVRDRSGDPSWATSTHPAWARPVEIPNGLDRVPGLIRKKGKVSW